VEQRKPEEVAAAAAAADANADTNADTNINVNIDDNNNNDNRDDTLEFGMHNDFDDDSNVKNNHDSELNNGIKGVPGDERSVALDKITFKNLIEEGCFYDNAKDEAILRLIVEAPDLSAIAEIAANATQPAKMAEQEANDVVKEAIRETKKKRPNVFESDIAKYTGNFKQVPGRIGPCGTGSYSEKKPRNGHLGCHTSFGEYVYGHETGHNEVNYYNSTKSTYRGQTKRGQRSGYGVMEYIVDGKHFSHIGKWKNEGRHGVGLYTNGPFCSFGQFKKDEAVGRHFNWKCGNDGNINEVEALNVPGNVLPKCRGRPVVPFLEGEALQAHIALRNKEGTGAKCIIEERGNCVPKNLDLHVKYVMKEEKTGNYFYFNRDNIVGRQTRSNGAVSVGRSEIYPLLLEQLEGGRDSDDWVEQGYWIDVFEKKWGFGVEYQYGHSKAALLGLRCPVFIVLDLARKLDYGGIPKNGRPNYNRKHAISLIPNKDGTSNLIDPDGNNRKLTIDEVSLFKDWGSKQNLGSNSRKRKAKEIFQECICEQFSCSVKSVFLISHPKPTLEKEAEMKKKKAVGGKKKKNKKKKASNGTSLAAPAAADTVTPLPTKATPFVPTPYVSPLQARIVEEEARASVPIRKKK